MFSLRNSWLFCTGGGNMYLACIRDTAWFEDSSIYEWTINKSTCSNGPWASKWEAEGISVWNGVVWPTWWETFRQLEPWGVSSWLVIKLVSRRQTPSQWDRLIKTVPPFIFGMLCHFENASTCIIPQHPWDNLISSINLSELELTHF